MTEQDWMSDPSIAGVDKAKLEVLQKLVFEGSKLSPREMLPFLMQIAKQGKDNGLNFSAEERDAIIAVLKKNSTPEELDKINKVMQMKRN